MMVKNAFLIKLISRLNGFTFFLFMVFCEILVFVFRYFF